MFVVEELTGPGLWGPNGANVLRLRAAVGSLPWSAILALESQYSTILGPADSVASAPSNHFRAR